MYTETRHFSRFVSRYGREYPGTQRTAAVLLIKVPHLHLMSKHMHFRNQHISALALTCIFSRQLSWSYQRIDARLILTHRHQDVVLFQLVQVCHAQLISLEAGQLQGAGQKPDLSIHMCITRVKENNWNHQIYNQPERTECWIYGKYKTHAFYKAGLLQPIEIRFDL